MPKVKMTVEIEFEANDAAAARAATIRVPGELQHAIVRGAGTMPTGVKGDSVRVNVKAKTIDGKSVS